MHYLKHMFHSTIFTYLQIDYEIKTADKNIRIPAHCYAMIRTAIYIGNSNKGYKCGRHESRMMKFY